MLKEVTIVSNELKHGKKKGYNLKKNTEKKKQNKLNFVERNENRI